ncbi:UbiH/UbiF family hydroxylase [uncultured Litoreibacter sp.]|uniref:UbiH/UbiF family hydroxylase n=1 Tax=uncultured Litoreibacter sp. TaxID=1392394 RepID=UPI0026112EF1|nr:UbiH/UbiF family hydroxylase [uncultured Litoreibacter sp.]
MSENTQILISGGGVAGLTAACLFGSNGFDVVCVDPAPPITDRDTDGADLRSTAFLQPSVHVLERAGVWHQLSNYATALQTMQIVDAGEDGQPRNARAFDASDISELPFGWNLPNWLIRRELVKRLEALTNVDFRPGVATQRMLARSSGAKVWLSNGEQIQADLVIAADGRGSPLRQAAGIEVKTKRYGQKAMAFAVTHPIPHDNVSTEIHRTGGPFTLVPLPDYEGVPSSAVVWMEDGPKAQDLFALDDAALNAAMSERSCHMFGPLTLASKRSIWPIISQVASRFSDRRLALVAEAAHVVPPIGAQGLNMSLADLQSLLELSGKHPLGSDDMLDAYDKERRRNVALRVAGIDLLNRTSQSEADWLRELRSWGIGVIHDAKPVRTTLMNMGLGLR